MGVKVIQRSNLFHQTPPRHLVDLCEPPPPPRYVRRRSPCATGTLHAGHEGMRARWPGLRSCQPPPPRDPLPSSRPVQSRRVNYIVTWSVNQSVGNGVDLAGSYLVIHIVHSSHLSQQDRINPREYQGPPEQHVQKR